MGIQISIENLHKVYQKGPERVHILKGIELDIDSGAQVAVTGVSGAGKSTLLHVLGTLERPTDGLVKFNNEDVFKTNDQELARLRNSNIGFVFQFHHLLEDFTAEENVSMPMLIHGAKREDALSVAQKVLDKVGLSHRMKHLPAELSGGEQQRVAIARALVMEPQLLLMDEPTGNLDAGTADDVHELIRSVAEEDNSTVIIVTHNTAFAQQMEVHYHLQDGQVAA